MESNRRDPLREHESQKGGSWLSEPPTQFLFTTWRLPLQCQSPDNSVFYEKEGCDSFLSEAERILGAGKCVRLFLWYTGLGWGASCVVCLGSVRGSRQANYRAWGIHRGSGWTQVDWKVLDIWAPLYTPPKFYTLHPESIFKSHFRSEPLSILHITGPTSHLECKGFPFHCPGWHIKGASWSGKHYLPSNVFKHPMLSQCFTYAAPPTKTAISPISLLSFPQLFIFLVNSYTYFKTQFTDHFLQEIFTGIWWPAPIPVSQTMSEEPPVSSHNSRYFPSYNMHHTVL